MVKCAQKPKRSRTTSRVSHPCASARTGDRRSAIRSHGLPVREALIQEWYNGREALIKDGAEGAARFKSGLGRHGDYEKI